MKKISLLALFSFFTVSLSAEEVLIPEPSIGLSITEILVLVGLIFTILLVVVVYLMYNTLSAFYHKKHEIDIVKVPKKWDEVSAPTKNLWERILALRPISEEKDMVLKHKYDGIEELNNPVPGWFNFLFYGTIIFGAIYLFIYEFSSIGETQREEYLTEVRSADAEKLANLKKLGASIDENSVKLDVSTVVLENGALMYNANCKSCHGEKGEGTVGPNLADDYWLHGGSINDIFKTIKYGVVDKGMVAWGKTLSPKNISDISNYIASLKGTNPPNAKAPQGEKYVVEVAVIEQ